MAKCSFGKVSLRGTFQECWPYVTELYARLFYLCTDSTEVLIAAMDTADTFPREAARFREWVSRETGIPAGNIWYHELQLHAAPGSELLCGESMDRIAGRVSEEVKRMKVRSVWFSCQVAEAYAGTQLTLNREQYVAGLGGVTVWAGLKYDGKGRPYCQDPSRMLLRGYRPELPVFKSPVYFDNPVDPLAYLFVFPDKKGEVLGTVSRFAAHPDAAVLFESHGVLDQYHYDYDWPGYLSEKLERLFRAPSMYLNGPCADLAAKKHFDGIVTYEKSAEECRRIGEEIADMLLSCFARKMVPLGDADNCKTVRFATELPMRDDFPHTMDEIAGMPLCAKQAERSLWEAVADGACPCQVKQLIDDCYRAERMPDFVDRIAGIDERTLQRGTLRVDVTALRLGDYLFVGLPGESLVEMTEWLRSTFTGVKTIPLDQVNGYYGYMATPSSLTLGGYTYWYSWTGRESIPKLKEDIVRELEDFLD